MALNLRNSWTVCAAGHRFQIVGEPMSKAQAQKAARLIWPDARIEG